MLMIGIVSSAMDAIISVDKRRKIILFNTAAESDPVKAFLNKPYTAEKLLGTLAEVIAQRNT